MNTTLVVVDMLMNSAEEHQPNITTSNHPSTLYYTQLL